MASLLPFGGLIQPVAGTEDMPYLFLCLMIYEAPKPGFNFITFTFYDFASDEPLKALCFSVVCLSILLSVGDKVC